MLEEWGLIRVIGAMQIMRIPLSIPLSIYLTDCCTLCGTMLRYGAYESSTNSFVYIRNNVHNTNMHIVIIMMPFMSIVFCYIANDLHTETTTLTRSFAHFISHSQLSMFIDHRHWSMSRQRIIPTQTITTITLDRKFQNMYYILCGHLWPFTSKQNIPC